MEAKKESLSYTEGVRQAKDYAERLQCCKGYATETRTGNERVQPAKPGIATAFSDYKQQQFIDFILQKYIADGVQELAQSKMRSLVELKYNTISDAAAEFGSTAAIRETFVGFQQYLYRD